MENISSREQHVEMLKRRTAHQFARNGVYVVLHVPVYRDDNLGGRILTDKKDIKVQGIITKASSGKSEMIANDAGKRGANEYILTILYDPCLEIEYNTHVTYGNKQYKILTVDNVAEMNVVYQIRMSSVPKHMEGYEHHGKLNKDRFQ